MKIDRAYYVLIVILSVLFSAWYFYVRPSKEAGRFVQNFIESLGEENRARPESLLSKTIESLSFITYFKVNRDISFEIVKTSRDGFDSFTTKVRFRFDCGDIYGTFRIKKTHLGFRITKMPSVLFIKCCLPISSGKKSNNILYRVDIAGKTYEVLSPPGLLLEIGTPVSIILFEDTIAETVLLKPLEIDRVMSVGSSYVEGYTLGMIPTDTILHVYKITNGKPVYSGDRAIPAGTGNITLYLLPSGKAVSAIFSHENLPLDTIRVAIGKTGFTGLIHDTVTIGSNSAFTVHTKSSLPSVHSFTSHQKLTLDRKGNGIYVTSNGTEILYTEERLYIQPENEGCLFLFGIERSQSSGAGYTEYRGVIEVSAMMHGLSIVNEIGLEEYLYSVVSSEMPVKFGLEPLKAQAVAARTYAVRCIMKPGFAQHGANVDDSTSSQVYNNVQIRDEAVQAVEATRGLVLFYNGGVVDARYFSTSCGYTASSHEVWDNEGVFPGIRTDYLVSRPQFFGKPVNITSDRSMKDFLEQGDPNFFDIYSPYFRWEVTMTGSQAEAVIKHNLEKVWAGELPPDLGKLIDIKTVKRGSGGIITHLLIKMTSGEYLVIKELNVRRVLQPINMVKGEKPVVLRLNDGSSRENFSLLPSAFAVIETVKSKDGYIETVSIKGGGFGHGVGMSQYGAYGLYMAGYTYDRILSHYYPGTELKHP